MKTAARVTALLTGCCQDEAQRCAAHAAATAAGSFQFRDAATTAGSGGNGGITDGAAGNDPGAAVGAGCELWYFNLILVDCGTGVTHPSMVGVLGNADAVVIAGSYAVSGARRAENTLRWLHANNYENLARTATVVLTQTATVSDSIDTTAIEQALGNLSAQVVTVPHDQSVADGAVLDLNKCGEATQQAYITIAAALAKTFR